MIYPKVVIISGWSGTVGETSEFHERLYEGLIRKRITPTFVVNKGLLDGYLAKWSEDPEKDKVLFVLGEGVVGRKQEEEVRDELGRHGVDSDSVHLLGELIAKGDEGYEEVVRGWSEQRGRGSSKEGKK